MFISKIQLKNFRNYKTADFQLKKGINIIYGQNAQGKTNILESIFVAATMKSHRTHRSQELIQIGQEESHIALTVEHDDYSEQFDIHLGKRKKTLAINRLPVKKLSGLLGRLHVVMFSPEDLNLIKSGPSFRRRFIDLELSMMNKVYYHHLNQYTKVMKQRNQLLKQIQKNKDLVSQLSIWNDQLIHHGSKIMEYRDAFINQLKEIYEKRHYEISGQKEVVLLSYENHVSLVNFEEKLMASQGRDIKYGVTSVGPHKDDLLFSLEGIDLRTYGSQGQQRTAALSLKLSEIELIQSMINDHPILLLDDVLSELDDQRQEYLLAHLENIQTIITCTGIEDFVKNIETIDGLYHVEKGQVMTDNESKFA